MAYVQFFQHGGGAMPIDLSRGFDIVKEGARFVIQTESSSGYGLRSTYAVPYHDGVVFRVTPDQPVRVI